MFGRCGSQKCLTKLPTKEPRGNVSSLAQIVAERFSQEWHNFFSTKCFSYNHYHHYAAFFPNCDVHSGSWVLPNLTFDLTFTAKDNRHYPKHSMPGPCLFLFYAAKEVAPLHMVIYIFLPITIHAAKLGHQKLQ